MEVPKVGIVAFPNGPFLYSTDLAKALQTMQKKQMPKTRLDSPLCEWEDFPSNISLGDLAGIGAPPAHLPGHYLSFTLQSLALLNRARQLAERVLVRGSANWFFIWRRARVVHALWGTSLGRPAECGKLE